MAAVFCRGPRSRGVSLPDALGWQTRGEVSGVVLVQHKQTLPQGEVLSSPDSTADLLENIEILRDNLGLGIMGLWIHNGSQHLDEISEYRTILGVCYALTILMICVVLLRMYTRGRILNSLGLDDYVTSFSAVSRTLLLASTGPLTDVLNQVLAGIYSGLCIEQSKWGLGLPVTMRPKPNLDKYSVVWVSFEVQAIQS